MNISGTSARSLSLPVLAALLAVYVFWGGTYLAMKFAIETLPPFLMAGIRFVTAGAILYIWELLRGTQHPNKSHWQSAAVVGGLLLLGGNGGVVWAEQMVPSGIAAIIIATVPLWMALIAWLWQGGGRPSGMVAFGLLLGLLGITLLVAKSSGSIPSGPVPWYAYLVLILAAFSWAVGSLYSRVANLPNSPLMSIALQMLTGGLFCLTVGLLTGELDSFNMSSISLRSTLSLGYLIFFGSIVAFSAYIWLLKVADPTVVSTYAYVNPVVAIFLGWILAGEQMGSNDALAALIIVIAVIIITKYNFRGKATAVNLEKNKNSFAG